jgi:polysaccharide deacetylase family protein (PEP-CTERM system associated)
MRILTFDIEDWFHILDHPRVNDPSDWSSFESRVDRNTEVILDELARRSLKASFFCLGWIADQHPHVIRRIVDAGHEVATHSHVHTLIHAQTRATFKQELHRSVSVLEDISGQKIRAFRAPGFSLTSATPWAFEALVDQGITIDSSICPTRHAHGGYPGLCHAPCKVELDGAIIQEFPISTCRIGGRDIVFSGGGYFRILPYRFIQAQMKRAPYVMSYFHPRDFDAGQPVLPDLSWHRRFRSYVGLASAFGKLRQLLDEFAYMDLATAVETIDWNDTPSLRLSGLPRPETPSVSFATVQQ